MKKALHRNGLVAQFAYAVQIVVMLFYPALALAGPDDPTVVGGDASVTQPDASTTLIQQGSDSAIINWRGFSIDVNELVRFEGGKATLNRVTGGDPSSILGQLIADHRIFIVNQNGVVFGPDSHVDVAGLVATTFNIENDAFMNGDLSFVQDQSAQLAAIVNKGEIRVSDNGFVFLVAPAVSNEGLIIANLGQVVLGAGTSMTLDFNGDGLVTYQVDGKVLDKVVSPDGKTMRDAVTNSGTIQANGGTVLLQADAANNVFDSLVNNSGVIEAQSLENHGGEVRLQGGAQVKYNGIGWQNNVNNNDGATGTVIHTGDIDVSAIEAGAANGTVVLSAEYVGVSGSIAARGASGADGGNVLISSTQKTVMTRSSLVDVSGDSSVGGLKDAFGATAGGASSAGNVVVWSDQTTRFFGTILGRGGELGGDGADLEVSGYGHLTYRGTVDTTAANGNRGSLLLDPVIVSLLAGPGDGDDTADAGAGADPTTFFGSPAGGPGTVLDTDMDPTTLFESEIEGQSVFTNISIIAGAIIANGGGGAFVINLAPGASINLETTNAVIGGGIDLTTGGQIEIVASGATGTITIAAATALGAAAANISVADLTTDTGAAISVTSGNGSVTSTDTITAGGGGTVTITATGGSIIDGGGADPNIIGLTANLTAGAGGIGDLDALETSVVILTFTSGGGNVNLIETDGATITGNSGGGNSTLASTAGDWTIGAAGIVVAGNLTMTAGGAIDDGAAGFITAGGAQDGLQTAFFDPTTTLTLNNAASHDFDLLRFNATATLIVENSDTTLTGVNVASTLTLTSAGAIRDTAATSVTTGGLNVWNAIGEIRLANDAADAYSLLPGATFNTGGAADIFVGSNGAGVASGAAVNIDSLSFDGANVEIFETVNGVRYADTSTIATAVVLNRATGNLILSSASGLLDLADDTDADLTVTGDALFVSTGFVILVDVAGDSLTVGGNASFISGAASPVSIDAGNLGATSFGSVAFSSGTSTTIRETDGTMLLQESASVPALIAGTSLTLISTGSVADAADTDVTVGTFAAVTATGAGGTITLVDDAADSWAVTGNASFTNAGLAAITINPADIGGASFGSLAFNGAAVTVFEDDGTVLLAESGLVPALFATAGLTLTSSGSVADAADTDVSVTGASVVTATTTITLVDDAASSWLVTGNASFTGGAASAVSVNGGDVGAASFGSLSFFGGAVTLVEDDGSMDLADVDSGFTAIAVLTANAGLSLSSVGGSINDAADTDVSVTGAATLGSGTSTTLVDDVDSSWAVTGNLSITAGTTISFNAGDAGAASMGSLSFFGTTVSIAEDDGSMDLADVDSGLTAIALLTATGGLTLLSVGGSINDAANTDVTVTGAAVVTAGTTITLVDDAASSWAVTGNASFTGGAASAVSVNAGDVGAAGFGSLSFFGGAVSIAEDDGNMNLTDATSGLSAIDPLTAGAGLTLLSVGGSVTDNADTDVTVTGAAVVTAGTTITLVDDAASSWAVTGNASFTAGAASALSVNAGDAGAASFGSLSFFGGAVSIAEDDGNMNLTDASSGLSAIDPLTAGAGLTLLSVGGTVTDDANTDVTVTGASTVTAGGDVLLAEDGASSWAVTGLATWTAVGFNITVGALAVNGLDSGAIVDFATLSFTGATVTISENSSLDLASAAPSTATVRANLTSEGGAVNETAPANGVAAVTAPIIVLSASTGIGSTGALEINAGFAAGEGLDARTTTGGIVITDIDIAPFTSGLRIADFDGPGLTDLFGLLVTADGVITVAASSPMVVAADAQSPDTITLTATPNGILDASTNDTTVNPPTEDFLQILNGVNVIVTDADAPDADTGDVVLSAGEDIIIGADGPPVTTVTTFDPAGTVTISPGLDGFGDLFVGNDDVVSAPNIVVNVPGEAFFGFMTAGNSITVNATDDIVFLATGGTLTTPAATGTVTLNAGTDGTGGVVRQNGGSLLAPTGGAAVLPDVNVIANTLNVTAGGTFVDLDGDGVLLEAGDAIPGPGLNAIALITSVNVIRIAQVLDNDGVGAATGFGDISIRNLGVINGVVGGNLGPLTIGGVAGSVFTTVNGNISVGATNGTLLVASPTTLIPLQGIRAGGTGNINLSSVDYDAALLATNVANAADIVQIGDDNVNTLRNVQDLVAAGGRISLFAAGAVVDGDGIVNMWDIGGRRINMDAAQFLLRGLTGVGATNELDLFSSTGASVTIAGGYDTGGMFGVIKDNGILADLTPSLVTDPEGDLLSAHLEANGIATGFGIHDFVLGTAASLHWEVSNPADPSWTLMADSITAGAQLWEADEAFMPAAGDDLTVTGAGTQIVSTTASIVLRGGDNVVIDTGTSVAGATITQLAAGSGTTAVGGGDNDFIGAVTLLGTAIVGTDAGTATIGATVLISGPNAFTAAATSTVSATGLARITADSDGDLAGAATLGITSAGTLIVNAAGDITDGAAVTVTGTSTLTSATGSVLLDNATNEFAGAVNATAANDVTIADAGANALVLGSIVTGGDAGDDVTLTAVGAITDGNNGATNVTGDILTITAGALTSFGTAANVIETVVNSVNTTGLVGGAAGFSMKNTGDLTVGPVTASGGIDIEAASNLTIAATIDAAGGNVTLLASESILSTVAATFLDIDNSVTTTLTASSGNGSIGDATAAGEIEVEATTLVLRASGAGIIEVSETVDGGTFTATSGSGNINLTSSAGAMVIASASTTGTLTATATGAITDTGALVIGGTTTLTAGANDITLNTATNDFTTVTFAGSTGTAVLVDRNAIDLGGTGASTLTALTVTASGNVTQSGALLATTLTVAAGAGGNVTLNTAGNDFDNAGFTSANNVVLVDGDDLDLETSTISGSFTVTVGGALTDDAAATLTVTGTTLINAGANPVTLNAATNNFSTVSFTLTTGDVTLVDAGGLDLGGTNGSTLASLTVTTGGQLTDSGALLVGGVTTLTAGVGNDIILDNSANDFGGAVSIVSGRDATLFDASALDFGASTVSRDLTVDARGVISNFTGALAVTGDAAFDAHGSAITLGTLFTGFAANFGTVTLNGGVLSLNEGSAVTLAGANGTSLALSSGFDITIAGDVNTTAGTTIAAGGDILNANSSKITDPSLVGVSLTAGGADGDIGAAGAEVLTNAAALTLSAGGTGDIFLTEDNGGTINAALGTGSATLITNTGSWTINGLVGSATATTVTMIATVGAIIDGFGGIDVDATNAVLVGGAGVGVGGDIDTAVANLAGFGGSGGFALTNTGALTVTTLGGVVGASSVTGNITIATLSPLTIAATVSTADDVTLSSSESGENCTDDLTTLDGARVTGHNVTLNGADDVVINDTVDAAENLTINAGDGVVINDFIFAGELITITTGALVFPADDLIACPNSLVFGPGGGLFADDIVITVVGDITLGILKAVDTVQVFAVDDPLTAAVEEGSIFLGAGLTGGKIVAGMSVTLTADEDILFQVSVTLPGDPEAFISAGSSLVMTADANAADADANGAGLIADTEADAFTVADILAPVVTATASGGISYDGQVDVLTAATTTSAAAGANVNITDLDDLLVGTVTTNAASTVTLTTGGAIIDGNALLNNVTTGALTATTGAGVNLDTTIAAGGTLAATVSGDGDIDIRNATGAGLLTVTAATVAGSGDVTVTNNSSMTVVLGTSLNGDVTFRTTALGLTVTAATSGEGDVNLRAATDLTTTAVTATNGGVTLVADTGAIVADTTTAGNGSANLTAATNLTVTTSVSATNGNANLTATGGFLLAGAGTTITATDGNANLTAGTTLTSNLVITTNGDATQVAIGALTNTTTTTTNGDAIFTGASVALTTVTAGGAGVGDGSIVASATAGSITFNTLAAADDTVTLTATDSINEDGDAGVDVTAAGFVARAATVTATGSVGGASSIETAVANLEGFSGTGGFFVNNAGAMTIGGITSTFGVFSTGAIVISTASPMNVNEDVVGASVALTALGAVADAPGFNDDINVASGVVVQATATTATLLAEDDINNGGTVVAATTATLTAGSGDSGDAAGSITDTNGDGVNVDAPTVVLSAFGNNVAGSAIDVDTTATTVTSATVGAGTGGIDIADSAGGLTVTLATTASGDVSVEAIGGDLLATVVTAGGDDSDITLTTTTAGNMTIGILTALADRVTLDSTGNVNDTDAGTAVTSAELVAVTDTGFGTADTINTTVDDVEGTGGTGVFNMTDSGDLTIGITTNSAQTGITADGAITVTTIDSGAGDTSIDVLENVEGGAAVTITATERAAANGNADDITVDPFVTVVAGTTLTMSAGDDLDLAGLLIAGGSALLTSGAGAGDTDAGGSIHDLNDTLENVIATDMTATAVGGATVDGSGLAISLDTRITTLTAATVGGGLAGIQTGGIRVEDTQFGMTSLSATTEFGSITLSATGGNLTIAGTGVLASSGGGVGNVILNTRTGTGATGPATSGNIVLGTAGGGADVTAAGDLVELNSVNAVTDGEADGNPDGFPAAITTENNITATNLLVRAVNGFGTGEDRDGDGVLDAGEDSNGNGVLDSDRIETTVTTVAGNFDQIGWFQTDLAGGLTIGNVTSVDGSVVSGVTETDLTNDGLFSADITIQALSPLTVLANVIAVGDIILIADEVLGAGDNLTVTSFEDVNLNGVLDAGEDANGNGVLDNTTIQSTLGDITLQAGDNVVTGTGAVVTAFDDLNIFAGSDADEGDLDGLGAATLLGTHTSGAGNPGGAGGTTTVTAIQNITLGVFVAADGLILFTSTGNILDGNGPALNVQANGSSTFTAVLGVIGLDTDAIEVEIQNGQLTANAGGSADRVSVSINGDIEPDGRFFSSQTAPGLELFNNTVLGGDGVDDVTDRFYKYTADRQIMYAGERDHGQPGSVTFLMLYIGDEVVNPEALYQWDASLEGPIGGGK